MHLVNGILLAKNEEGRGRICEKIPWESSASKFDPHHPQSLQVWYLVAISQLGAGLVGPFNSPSNENILILVAMEYFTKWVEAIPLRKATGEPW